MSMRACRRDSTQQTMADCYAAKVDIYDAPRRKPGQPIPSFFSISLASISPCVVSPTVSTRPGNEVSQPIAVITPRIITDGTTMMLTTRYCRYSALWSLRCWAKS